MKLSLRTFHQLRWKFTFSYVVFPSLVMLILDFFAFVIILVVILLFFVPPLVLYGLQQYQDPLRPFFVHNGIPDQQALALWIKKPGGSPSGYQPDFRAIVDKEGRVVVSTGSESVPSGIMLQTRLSTQAAANLRQVLTGKAGDQGLVNKNSNGAVTAIVPILGEHNEVYGALIDDTSPSLYVQETLYWLRFDSFYILVSVAIYTIFATIGGIIGGFLTARTITRRFNKLALAADNWSQGDFSMFVQDASDDEIGQLTRKLNRMAEQLQNLLRTRQKFAILEERNRLARDLHDSVKQHIFVIALQVGTAKLQLGENDVVQQHLTEAEHVLLQVQEELKTLIRELRPADLVGKGLSTALQDLVNQWSRQNSIATIIKIEEEQLLPVLLEEALFRITQEALANVARHSQANTVDVQLTYGQEAVTLTIADNGKGFDTVATQAGIGLLSMQERMKTLGGEGHIESTLGKGTRVTARYAKQYLE
jgi:signal transduction histidine kinase